MGKLIDAFTAGIKSNGQAELANYHNNFNQFLQTNPYSHSQSSDDASELSVYGSGATAWVNIALNRKMLDVANVEYFFVDQDNNRIDNKNVPEDILAPFSAGYAGMGLNEMLAAVCGHEDLTGNALWVMDTNANRYTQLAGLPGRFIPIAPGCFKIKTNAKETAIEYFTVTWGDGSQSNISPDKVVQFKRNAIIKPIGLIGVGLISQGRVLLENEQVSVQYQNNFMEKDGTPDLIYIDKNVSNPDMARSKAAQLRSDYRAGKYSNSIMYAAGEIDIKAFSISSADLQYIENRKLNGEQVISLMESTGTVLGLPDANNKASAGVLTNAYFGIVNSRIDHLIETINNQFVWTIKGNEKRKISLSFTPYATGDIDTIQKAVINGLMSPANGSKAMGLPVDEKNEAAKALYVGAGLRTLQYAYETVPAEFGALADNIDETKKKTTFRDYE